MSILIKGMEMPTRCGRCDMRIPTYFDDGVFDHYECCITAAIIDNLGEKMEDCPLVPVPPHGRLIDADALAEHKFVCIPKVTINGKDAGYAYRLGWNTAIEAVMENAETIIGEK